MYSASPMVNTTGLVRSDGTRVGAGAQEASEGSKGEGEGLSRAAAPPCCRPRGAVTGSCTTASDRMAWSQGVDAYTAASLGRAQAGFINPYAAAYAPGLVNPFAPGLVPATALAPGSFAMAPAFAAAGVAPTAVAGVDGRLYASPPPMVSGAGDAWLVYICVCKDEQPGMCMQRMGSSADLRRPGMQLESRARAATASGVFDPLRVGCLIECILAQSVKTVPSLLRRLDEYCTLGAKNGCH